MDDEKRTLQAGAMRAVMTHLPLETWNELDAIAQREASTVAAVLRRLATERLEQVRAGAPTERLEQVRAGAPTERLEQVRDSAPQDRRAERREFADTQVAHLVGEAIPLRDQPVPTPHHAWYEDTLRAIGHELDRSAVNRVTIVELEQCLLVYGHQSTQGECVRFEKVWTAEDLMALLEEAYARRRRPWAAHKAS
jgi:hypothetical protein